MGDSRTFCHTVTRPKEGVPALQKLAVTAVGVTLTSKSRPMPPPMRKSHSLQLTPEASHARPMHSGGGEAAARRRLMPTGPERAQRVRRLAVRWERRTEIAWEETVVFERGVVRKEMACSTAS